VAFGGGSFSFFPHVLEKTPDPAVVQALFEAPARRFAARVVGAALSLSRAMFLQLVERVRPVVPVDEIEVRIT